MQVICQSGSKTKLNYVTSNGLVLETTPNKTTTVLGTYKSDTGAILEELGNVKSLDFGSRDGGFNLLNTPDELYVSPSQFWNEYNKPLDELANSGVKYNPEDIVAITKTADGKLVWLENGTDTAGLNHIITEHADDFLNKGITQEQIPDYVMNALENGKIVGYQGRGTERPIYEFTYNGEIHKVAITVGNNGFIVGANPKDSVK